MTQQHEKKKNDEKNLFVWFDKKKCKTKNI